MRYLSTYKKYLSEGASPSDAYSYLKSLYLESNENKNPYLNAYTTMLSKIYNRLFPGMDVDGDNVLGNIRNMDYMIRARDLNHELIDNRTTLYNTIVNADETGDIGTKAWFDRTVGNMSARSWGEHLSSFFYDIGAKALAGSAIGWASTKIPGGPAILKNIAYKGINYGTVGGAAVGVIGVPFSGGSNYFAKIQDDIQINKYIDEAKASIHQLEEIRENEFEMKLKAMGITHADLKKIQLGARTSDDFESALGKADRMIHPKKYAAPPISTTATPSTLHKEKSIQIMFYIGLALIFLGILFICGSIMALAIDYNATKNQPEEPKNNEPEVAPQQTPPISIPQPAAFENYDASMSASSNFFETILAKLKSWVTEIVKKIIPGQIHAILFGIVGVLCLTGGGWMVYKSYEGAY